MHNTLTNPTLQTIFDREEAEWGEAPFIQLDTTSDKIYKCLNMPKDKIQMYIDLSNALKDEIFSMNIDQDKLNIHIANESMGKPKDPITEKPIQISINGTVHHIDKIQMNFNTIDQGLYPVSDSQNQKLGKVGRMVDYFRSEESFIYSSPYIAGNNMLEFKEQQKQLGYGDIDNKIGEITQNIYTFICDFFENNDTYKITGEMHPGISEINIKIIKAENGILYLTMTDIGGSIGQLLEKAESLEIKE